MAGGLEDIPVRDQFMTKMFWTTLVMWAIWKLHAIKNFKPRPEGKDRTGSRSDSTTVQCQMMLSLQALEIMCPIAGICIWAFLPGFANLLATVVVWMSASAITSGLIPLSTWSMDCIGVIAYAVTIGIRLFAYVGKDDQLLIFAKNCQPAFWGAISVLIFSRKAVAILCQAAGTILDIAAMTWTCQGPGIVTCEAYWMHIASELIVAMLMVAVTLFSGKVMDREMWAREQQHQADSVLGAMTDVRVEVSADLKLVRGASAIARLLRRDDVCIGTWFPHLLQSSDQQRLQDCMLQASPGSSEQQLATKLNVCLIGQGEKLPATVLVSTSSHSQTFLLAISIDSEMPVPETSAFHDAGFAQVDMHRSRSEVAQSEVSRALRGRGGVLIKPEGSIRGSEGETACTSRLAGEKDGERAEALKASIEGLASDADAQVAAWELQREELEQSPRLQPEPIQPLEQRLPLPDDTMADDDDADDGRSEFTLSQ